MALDPLYIVASDLEQYFVDKDSGLPLANGTITFYRDIARNVPKPVFQLSGTPPSYSYTSMGAQITLSSVGTVQNSGGDNEVIYYYPWIINDEGELELDLYYVVVRNSDGIEQFTREGWPNVTLGDSPINDEPTLTNQISNPQFTNVFINQPATVGGTKTTTYTVTAANQQVFAFAPNWDFVISGTGTVTIFREAISGNDNVVTSPPYVLDVSVSAGITECFMRQRFSYNSGLWATTPDHQISLSGCFVARNEDVGTAGIQMLYEESSGGGQVVIVDGSFSTNYVLVSGTTAAPIPQSTNTDLGKDGYIDILLSFPTLSHTRITSIQVIPVLDQTTNLNPFDANSSNREEAYQGDYYIPRLNQKPVESILTGWDFTVNPYQFAASGNIATTAEYITDQTIAARGATGNVAWAVNAITGGIQFTTSGTDDAFYIMQYISGAQAKKILGTRLAVNIFAFKTAVGDPVTARVYLYRGSSAATFPTLPTSIGSVAADGVFTLSAANWSLIARSGLDTPQANIATLTSNDLINNGNFDYGFSQWEVTDATQIGDTDKFACVVTFQYADASTVITVNSVSVVPGDLPCRPAEKSLELTLTDCQFYWEKSYNRDVYAATSTEEGAIIAAALGENGGGNVSAYALPFGFDFNTCKRVVPNLTIYSLTGGLNNITATAWTSYIAKISANAGIVTFWETPVKGQKRVFYLASVGGINPMVTAANGGDLTKPFGDIRFHFIADARLGKV